jgi:LCP family protein required for cell wall assembly
MSDDRSSRREYKTYRSNPAAARVSARDRELMGEAKPRSGSDAVDRAFHKAESKRRRARPRAAGGSRRRVTVRRVVLVAGLLLLVALVGVGIWGFIGFRTLDKAVAKSNARITPETEAALTPDSGSIFSTPTTILILGVDKRGNDPGRSDSMMLLRSDPDTKTFSQLSIARDMWVSIPGQGMGKINTAYFWGGLPLAIETVEDFTGVPINHIVLMKLNNFPRLIDAVGGIEIDVPKDISSWYSGGKTVTFKKGVNRMNGTEAMIYARIRAVDDDFRRQARQQQVTQALQQKLTAKGNVWRLPQLGSEVMRSLTTDLTTWELTQLVWRKWRAGETQRAIMKGTPAWRDGQAVVISDKQANLQLIEEFLSN